MIENMDEEVSIIDLFWVVLKRWKIIVISVVIFAFAGVGYLFILNNEDYEVNKITLTNQEKNEIDSINLLLMELDEKKIYMNESVAMKIDPYLSKEIILQYFVDAESDSNELEDVTDKNTSALTNAYVFYSNNDLIVETMIDLSENTVEKMYIDELISAENGLESYEFFVHILGEDETEMNQIAEYVKQSINEYHFLLSEKLGIHSVQLINQSYAQNTNFGFVERKEILTEKIEELNEEISKRINDLSDEQYFIFSSQQFEFLSSYTDYMTYREDDNKIVLTMIIALLLGVLVSVFSIITYYYLSDRILNIREIQYKFDIWNFGILSNQYNEKIKESKIDSYIYKKNNKDKRYEKQKSSTLYMEILMLCDKKAISQLFLTTTLENDKVNMSLINGFILEMKKRNIEVFFDSEFIYNPVAMKQACELGNVILIEKACVTKWQSVKKTIEFARKHEVNILGVISMK